MIVLNHHAERALQLVSISDPNLLRIQLLNDTIRLSRKKLSPIFANDPEYNSGTVYPKLSSKSDIEKFFEVRLSAVHAIQHDEAQIVPDSDTATDEECNLCGNYTSFQDSMGCRLSRIQKRQMVPLSFAPLEDDD